MYLLVSTYVQNRKKYQRNVLNLLLIRNKKVFYFRLHANYYQSSDMN